jgi:predicted glycoside hydrolase/deacetylase ChbG (UPF0249 family)
MTMLKSLLLCADDFAQNVFISEGITTLVRHNKINALSCLVNSPYWREAYKELHPILHHTFIGLHVNFTFGQPLSSIFKKNHGLNFPTLPMLLKNCYAKRLSQDVVEAEIESQLDRFTNDLNTTPDFIDGHQHVLQFPVIRDAFLNIYQKYHLQALVRNTSNGWRDLFSVTSFPKRQLLFLLGSQRFKNNLNQRNIPTNSSFAGVYAFDQSRRYGQYFRQFLHMSQHQGMIMCHPGLASIDGSDPLQQHRINEFNYFQSAAFNDDLTTHSFQLAAKALVL